MKKANQPTGRAKPAQKRPAQRKLATKARPEQTGPVAELAGVVAQLAASVEKLAQAADRLAEATARVSSSAELRHERIETPSQSPADSTAAQHEAETGHTPAGE